MTSSASRRAIRQPRRPTRATALRICRLLIAGLTAATAPLVAQPAQATDDVRTVIVRSFDGTPLLAHFFPSPAATGGHRRPIVIIAHGFGEAGPTTPSTRLAGAVSPATLLAAGYNVLTWDARGMGGSGGTSYLDSPALEVRDVQTLITWAAHQPQVKLDRPNDPRVGMVGASYGGIIEYLTAAVDKRLDVIAPAYTAYSLNTTTLSQNGKFKDAWGALLGVVGVQAATAGLTSPLGPQIRAMDPAAITGITESIAAGTMTPAFGTYLDYRSPSTYLARVHIPTLIQGGTSDTLFPLRNAVSDYLALKQTGTRVAMDWNCEGHSTCLGDAGPLVSHFDHAVIAWFRRYLSRNRRVPVGPGFSWIADNEAFYREAETYPPSPGGALTGAGAGTLLLSPVGPLASGGLPLVGARPAINSVNVAVAPPGRQANVLGFPSVTITYRGLAVPAHTWVYGQIVDRVAHRVVGGQVTAIPLELDGREHTSTVQLNAIASRATTTDQYEVQLMPGSLIFGLQRSTGLVDFTDIHATMPLIR